MKGMVVSGLVGSVFLLGTTALLLHEADWWGHVTARYPAQSVLEPSVTVFAAYAVEAGVFIHRLARRGVVTFADAVPFYGKVLCCCSMACSCQWPASSRTVTTR